MKTTFRESGLALLTAGLMAAALPSFAVAQNSGPSAEQLLQLIQQQQKQLDQMKAALQRAQSAAEQASVKAEEAKTAAPGIALSQYVNVGGVVEVEATESEAFDGSNTSDITLATVELFVDATPTDWLTGHVQLIYEDDGTETIDLDEAFATIGNTEKFPIFLQAGKWVVPFGNFDTDMSADPLTLDFAETKEAAVLVGVTASGFSAQAFVFNGGTQQANSGSHIDQYGVAVGYEADVGAAQVKVGAGYISNIGDSDNMTTALGGNASGLNDYVAAYELNGAVSFAGFTLRGNYISATDAFQNGELAFAGRGAEPAAWHTEIAYTTPIMERDVTFALTAQGTEEALALGLAERRLGAAVTIAVMDHTALTFEYLRDEDYGTADGGTGNNGHTGTVKLAVEF